MEESNRAHSGEKGEKGRKRRKKRSLSNKMEDSNRAHSGGESGLKWKTFDLSSNQMSHLVQKITFIRKDKASPSENMIMII